MYIIKSFFREFGKVILSLGVIGLLCLGVYSIVTESYKVGKDVQSKKTVVQTIAILDLQAENSNLKTQIIELDGNNYTLKILTQTQQEEIDNLKGTITSLNSSLTSLRNEKEATDEVVSNLQNDIAYLNEYVAELEAQLGGSKNILVMSLPEDFVCLRSLPYYVSDDYLFFSSDKSSCPGLWKYNLKTHEIVKVYDLLFNYNSFAEKDNYIFIFSVSVDAKCLVYDKSTDYYVVSKSISRTSKYYMNDNIFFLNACEYFDFKTNSFVELSGSSNYLFSYAYGNYCVFTYNSYFCYLDLNTLTVSSKIGSFVGIIDSYVIYHSSSSSNPGHFAFDLNTGTEIVFCNDYLGNVTYYCGYANGNLYPLTNFMVGKFISEKYLYIYSSTNSFLYVIDIETNVLEELYVSTNFYNGTLVDDNLFFFSGNYEFCIVTGKTIETILTCERVFSYSIFSTSTGVVFNFSNTSMYGLYYYDYIDKTVTLHKQFIKYDIYNNTESSVTISAYYDKITRINESFYLIYDSTGRSGSIFINNDLSVMKYYSAYVSFSGFYVIYETEKYIVTHTCYVIDKDTATVVRSDLFSTSSDRFILYSKLEDNNVLLKPDSGNVLYLFDSTTGEISFYGAEIETEEVA